MNESVKNKNPLRILLIDDDEWVRRSLFLFFINNGNHCVAAETAEEGIEELKKQTFDIIFIDYKLPGMNGLNFLRKIQEGNLNVKKVFITAHGNKNIFTEAKRYGAQECLEKPLSPEGIEEILARSGDSTS